jgi:integrase
LTLERKTRLEKRKSKTTNIVGLRSREGRWHYRFKANGQEYSGSTGLADTKQNVNAALEVRALERQRILGGGSLPPEIFPFSKASDQFLDWCDGEYQEHPSSAGRIRTSFASLRRFFRNEPVVNVREGAIEDYKTYRRAQRIAEITLRHDLHNLSLFFQYAKKQRWCDDNPVREVEIPSDEDAVRMYVLTEEEEAAYFEAARAVSLDLYDVGRIMLLQGCRPEEVFSLEQSSIDLDSGTFLVTKGKSKAARRRLKMMDEVREILFARLKTPGRWVFPSNRKVGRPITKLNNAHNRACELAGLDIVQYDLRHTCATRWAQSGTDLPTIAALLGHGNLRSVQKYIHVQESHMHAAIVRYQRYLESRKADAGDGPSPFRPPTKEDDERFRRF